MFWNISGGQPSGYIEKNQGACIPMFAPVDVQLDQDDKTMVQPDLMIVCDRKAYQTGGFRCAGFYY